MHWTDGWMNGQKEGGKEKRMGAEHWWIDRLIKRLFDRLMDG